VSLSRRLVLTLLAISAAGLLAVALVSYAALRSYLSDRLDQQVEQSLPLAARIVSQKPGPGSGPLPTVPLPAPDSDDVPPNVLLPAGAYAELRDADGDVIASRLLDPSSSTSKPDLPMQVPAPESPGQRATFDVPAIGSGPGFRVAVERVPDGSVLIAALPLRDYEDTLSRVRRIELIVSLAVLAALAVVSLIAVRAGLRPLARMERTAREIAAGDMSHRVEDVDERTEVGRLGLAFNEMLTRLERAFARQRESERRLRRFLADASHELRTPLSSIRGYAELFRMGASADPADLERSMSRIESESERMGGLVDDLLTLARLDEVQEPPREPVDIAGIVADACADAGARHPEREVRLEVSSEPTVLGDADALRQLAGNLIANALTHADEGPVEVGVATEGSEVVLSVRDHGPGLPEGGEQDVFERFWRAGEARDRASGGAGLGLAIVAGVAASHGGTAEARNASGGGALFTVRLPVDGD
jgi:two-component system OmpR family sensor kinase